MSDERKPRELTNAEQEAVIGGAEYYVVKSGDTLKSIADKYGTSLTKLAAHNHITNPDMIKPGQKIKIIY